MNAADAPEEQDPEEFYEKRINQLKNSITRRAPLDAVVLLNRESDELVADVLERLEPTLAVRILSHMDPVRGELLRSHISDQVGEQWGVNLNYDEDSVGRLMEPPIESYPETMTVQEVVGILKNSARERQVIYAYTFDEDRRLTGVVAMRELLFAAPEEQLRDIMVEEPFYFRADSTVEEAMKAVLLRHYPIYPVCDEERRLVGFIRGYALFERHTYELTAQTGQMVGIYKEEHVSTPWWRCLFLRHPWLQLNLLTAFLAGAVVGMFDETISKIVVLTAFLPVLAGQSGNTGCQALAVTLRGLTLNELKPGMEKMLLFKEALLGSINGFLVGITAGIGMYFYSKQTGSEISIKLSLVVLLAMIVACIASGVTGVMVPLVLRKLGADPATASSIFLTTATDVISMGLLLGLATLLIL